MGFVAAAVSRYLHHLQSPSNTTAKQRPLHSVAGCHPGREIFNFSSFFSKVMPPALQPAIARVRGVSPK